MVTITTDKAGTDVVWSATLEGEKEDYFLVTRLEPPEPVAAGAPPVWARQGGKYCNTEWGTAVTEGGRRSVTVESCKAGCEANPNCEGVSHLRFGSSRASSTGGWCAQCTRGLALGAASEWDFYEKTSAVTTAPAATAATTTVQPICRTGLLTTGEKKSVISAIQSGS